MTHPDIKDFTVHKSGRSIRVTHTSGAVVVFPHGLKSDSVMIERGDLFPGFEQDLLEAARKAAVKAGMKD